MSPLVITLASSGLFFIADKWWERRKSRGALAGLPSSPSPSVKGAFEPLPMAPEHVAFLTQPTADGRALMFDPPKVRLMREHLSRWSVSPVPIDAGPLGKNLQAWQVVASRPGLLNAREMLDHSHSSGSTVLGSLYLPLVTTAGGSPGASRMLMIVGGRDLLRLAGPGGHFAVLSRMAPELSAASQEPPVPEPTPSQDPVPPVVPGDEETPAEDPTEPVVPAASKSNGAVLGKIEVVRVPKNQVVGG